MGKAGFAAAGLALLAFCAGASADEVGAGAKGGDGAKAGGGNGIGQIVSGLARDGVHGRELAELIHQLKGRGHGRGNDGAKANGMDRGDDGSGAKGKGKGQGKAKGKGKDKGDEKGED